MHRVGGHGPGHLDCAGYSDEEPQVATDAEIVGDRITEICPNFLGIIPVIDSLLNAILAMASASTSLLIPMRHPVFRRRDFHSRLALARVGLSTANASQHLRSMLRVGIVTTTRQGKFVVYKLADHAVLALLSSLRKISERNSAEVERLVRNYFDNLDSLEPVTRKELMQRLRRGGVMVLDVRPEDEFSLGHLPGAMNIPELLQRVPYVYAYHAPASASRTPIRTICSGSIRRISSQGLPTGSTSRPKTSAKIRWAMMYQAIAAHAISTYPATTVRLG